MKLYFLRHGLAGQREDWPGDDNLRPLTKNGKKNMVREAERLARLNLGLDSIITSPLTRADQTAQIVAERLGLQNRLVKDDRLAPGFGLQALSEILDDHPGESALMLVGHEPDFSATITALIGGGKVVCKKGGLARVDLTVLKPPEGELVWLLPPKLLAAT